VTYGELRVRQCALNKFKNQATGVFVKLTGAGDGSAVNDGLGLSTALKPGPCEAWRKVSSDTDMEIEMVTDRRAVWIVTKPVNTKICFRQGR